MEGLVIKGQSMHTAGTYYRGLEGKKLISGMD